MAILHYLIYFNSTHSQLDGSWPYYCVITYVEFAAICLSYPVLAYLAFLMATTRPFHVNLKILWFYMVAEYNIEMTARSLQIFLIFYSKENSDMFYYASFLRCFCYFVVSLIIPAFVVERSCASYFLSDYEYKSRIYISGIILAVMTVTGVALSYCYHQAESTLVLHSAMMVVNCLASLVNVLLEKFNFRKLYESSNLRKGHREYSLAERFQISENIRTCLTLKAVINTVALFNLVSTVTAALDNFQLSISLQNLGATIFNVCIIIYGSIAYYTIYSHIPVWQTETLRHLMRLRLSGPVSPTPSTETSKPLAAISRQTDTYFDQLNRQWQ
ncbi:unnamed protein product [Caenorhabditis auriculariae]|uniref:Uncharacterized protein n=1 Tax=Caenorhabditis auriculariae TaxID=2777116 RepID=A0A8S1HD18_9PELO|nr:unnamed protein product [Caenorhabditis auriculariae]